MREFKKRLIAANPLLCLVAFLAIGFTTGKWHPAWVLFLLIPILPMILEARGLYSLFPILVTAVYVILGLIFKSDWWHPGWLIFFAIPLFYIFFPKKSGLEKLKNSKAFKKIHIKFDDDDIIDDDSNDD